MRGSLLMANGKTTGKLVLPKQKDLFLVKKFTYKGSVPTGPANRTRDNLSFSVPIGYKIFSIVGFSGGNTSVQVSRIDFDEETNIMRVNNTGTTQQSSSTEAFIYVAFIKEEYADGFWFDQ